MAWGGCGLVWLLVIMEKVKGEEEEEREAERLHRKSNLNEHVSRQTVGLSFALSLQIMTCILN